jgi:hypothetical protein
LELGIQKATTKIHLKKSLKKNIPACRGKKRRKKTLYLEIEISLVYDPLYQAKKTPFWRGYFP